MKQYVVDAFTTEVFKGNQAAVCFPKTWPSDDFMTKVAMENKFSETAFIIKEDGKYHIRWFTLSGEIDFCGHATLASAHTIKEFVEPDTECIEFTSMHGPITVLVKDGMYEMHFPPYALHQVPVTDAMEEACGRRPLEAWMDRDLLCLFEDEDFIRNMEPDQEKVAQLDGLLFHCTARGSGEYDCVSRTFAPKCNVAEDPVCGSGHCHIVPYWADKLGKKEIVAFQASARSGVLYGEITDTDMTLSGYAATFSQGEIRNEDGKWDCEGEDCCCESPLKRIATNDAPPAIGPYSQGMIAGDFLYTSGQGPLDKKDASVVGTTITEQAEYTFSNLKGILDEAGTDFTRVAKCNCYLADMADFAEFNKVYEKYVVSKPPRTCVAVKDLPKGIKCEVEFVVYLGK